MLYVFDCSDMCCHWCVKTGFWQGVWPDWDQQCSVMTEKIKKQTSITIVWLSLIGHSHYLCHPETSHEGYARWEKRMLEHSAKVLCGVLAIHWLPFAVWCACLMLLEKPLSWCISNYSPLQYFRVKEKSPKDLAKCWRCCTGSFKILKKRISILCLRTKHL